MQLTRNHFRVRYESGAWGSATALWRCVGSHLEYDDVAPFTGRTVYDWVLVREFNPPDVKHATPSFGGGTGGGTIRTLEGELTFNEYLYPPFTAWSRIINYYDATTHQIVLGSSASNSATVDRQTFWNRAQIYARMAWVNGAGEGELSDPSETWTFYA